MHLLKKNLGEIVIVDYDNEAFLAVLSEKLSREHYGVRIAHSTDEGLALIRKTLPDLVLLELIFPKKDGFEVLEEIRRSPELKMTQVIILSVLDDDESITKALHMGAADYLVKTQHAVHEIVEKVVGFLADMRG
jgi:DNA-binding response OmpR family regulator